MLFEPTDEATEYTIMQLEDKLYDAGLSSAQVMRELIKAFPEQRRYIILCYVEEALGGYEIVTY